MQVSSDLIPHSDFHKGQWLRAKSQWYYFYQTSKQTEYRLPTSKTFYQTIDEQLLSIVKYLHGKGIATTPSCQGHFYTEDYYRELYHRLCVDAELINTTGITIQNDIMEYLYVNNYYELPWTESEFLQQTQNYQINGVLGFIDPHQQYYHAIKDNQTDDIKITVDEPVTIIQTRSANNSIMISNWEIIYNIIQSVTR